MTFDTPLGAALFVLTIVASVATVGVTLFRSTVALERWLDSEPANPMSDRRAGFLANEPRAIVEQQGDTRAA